MECFKTTKEAERYLKKMSSGFSSDTIFMAKCFPLMMKMNDRIIELLEKRQSKRKPSEWNRFMSYHMKQGKSLKEVAEMWQSKKEMLSK